VIRIDRFGRHGEIVGARGGVSPPAASADGAIDRSAHPVHKGP